MEIIVCPAVDGTSVYFHPVASALPTTTSIRYLDLPGAFDDGAVLDSVEGIARVFADQLSRSVDVVVVGWSFGSMLAWHLVWLLGASEHVRLIAIDPLWLGRFLGIDSIFDSIERDQFPASPPSVPGSRAKLACRKAQWEFRPRSLDGRTRILVGTAFPSPECVEQRLREGLCPNAVVQALPFNHHAIVKGAARETAAMILGVL
jgi:pimeloyl-ACP methyl ester carboxylesterase